MFRSEAALGPVDELILQTAEMPVVTAAEAIEEPVTMTTDVFSVLAGMV